MNYSEKIKCLGVKISRVLLILLIILPNFIGYTPMIANASDEMSVKTFEELRSYLFSSDVDKIKIENDIEFNNTITINNEKVVIDLNGKDLVAASGSSMFNVLRGNITFTNSSNTPSSIRSKSNSRVFKIFPQNNPSTNSNINLNIENINFQDFNISGEGSIIYFAGTGTDTTININNSNFLNNKATRSGGVINARGGNITINNSKFINTTVNATLDNGNYDILGGAIYTKDTAVTISNTNISDNSIINSIKSSFGAGLAIIGGTLNINNSHITNNIIDATSGVLKGAGLYVDGSNINSFTENDISNNTFKSNTSPFRSGGGIYLEKETTGILKNSTFKDNSSYEGGGVYNLSSSLSFENDEFTNNIASNNGGAIYNDNVSTTVINSNFLNNKAINGGAIYNEKSSIQVSNTTFKNNTASSNGGGIYLKDNFSNIEFKEDTFTSNNATRGGGIYLSRDIFRNKELYPITITGGSFAGNQCSEYGGGIYARYIDLKVNSVTVNGNVASGDNGKIPSGGGIYSFDSSVDFSNNIITNNNAIYGGGIYTQIADDTNKYKVTFTNNKINYNTAEDPKTCKYEYCGAGGGMNITFVDDVDVDFNINSGEFIGNNAADGGAIFFGYTWTNPNSNLVLKKALITGNTASRGGGVWLCPQSVVNMYSSLGSEIYDNIAAGDVLYSWNYGNLSQTLKSAGDDIFYEGDAKEDLQYSLPNTRTALKVSSRSWGGRQIDWYKDESNHRYNLGYHVLANRNYLQGEEGSNGTKKLTALHGNNEIDERKASLIMTKNSATRRGGAIFTNNIIDFGIPEDIDLTVDKKFIVDGKEYKNISTQNPVYINLYRIDKNNNYELLDSNIELNKDNNWSYTFHDLPARYGEGDEVYRYTVRESDESKLIDKTSDNGSDGICNTDKNCKIILRNSYVLPKTPATLIDKVTNPKTKDEILKYLILFIISIISASIILIKKYNFNRD